jgi:hypothetical protein
VRDLTLPERGLWIDLLALCARGTPIGYLTDHEGKALTVYRIAKLTSADRSQVKRALQGILAKGVASRDGDGRIYNRRMVRTQNGSLRGTANLPQQIGADLGADSVTLARAKSGAKGGASTRQKWQQLQAQRYPSPGKVPEQKRDSFATASLSLSKSLPLGETQSEPAPVSETGEKGRLQPSPALLDHEARTRPIPKPDAVPNHQEATDKKQPAETSRAEIDAMLAAKRNKGAKPQ